MHGVGRSLSIQSGAHLALFHRAFPPLFQGSAGEGLNKKPSVPQRRSHPSLMFTKISRTDKFRVTFKLRRIRLDYP